MFRVIPAKAKPTASAFATVFARRSSGGSAPFGGSQPGPIPLADKDQQREFEKLVKQFNDQADQAHPDAPKTQPRKEFEGPKNPVTGEVNGPSGPEPTRFGDWEKNGRVYDF
ncbi:hypothetical protein BC830DRAFT_1100652 [Chytriomyces sp. MP71]|nr:hypothetical protein BC830DRAFT_1100652 [Chytriomyces sp. MP71]